MNTNNNNTTTTTECDNCGEWTTDAISRPNGSTECARCWEASLDHGFLHVPEAFECEVCGEQKRSAVADDDDRVVCAECRAKEQSK